MIKIADIACEAIVAIATPSTSIPKTITKNKAVNNGIALHAQVSDWHTVGA